MQHSNTLSPVATSFPDFNAAVTTCVIFCEAENYLFTMPQEVSSQARKWSLPGGNLHPSEVPAAAAVRILSETTPIRANASQLIAQGARFARIEGIDSIIHFFSLRFDSKPVGTESYRWISIYALSVLDQIEERDVAVTGRAEAFDILTNDRIWKRVPAEGHAAAAAGTLALPAPTQLIFSKSGQRITFDNNRKLVITLLGTVHSGKTTQGELLHAAYGGMPVTSDGEIFSEEVSGSTLKKMVVAFKEKHQTDPLPIELRLGMIVKKLSKQDFLAGYILKGFPGSEEDCEVLLGSLVRNDDCFIPVLLDLPDSEAKQRIEAVHSKVNHDHEMRLAAFNQSKAKVSACLNQRKPLLSIPVLHQTTVEAIFHQINIEIQRNLDTLAAQERLEATRTGPVSIPPAHPSSASAVSISSNRGIGDYALIGCAAAVGFVACWAWTRTKTH